MSSSFLDQLNALCVTPASRVKLLTLRGIWRDRRARNSFYCESSCGVHLDSLLAHLWTSPMKDRTPFPPYDKG